MNGITFTALIFLGYCVVRLVIVTINNTALYIARKQGKRKALEWIAMQDRLTRRGEYNVNEGWGQ
jgi:F420-0:gamma-glutamyl ligase-like protein